MKGEYLDEGEKFKDVSLSAYSAKGAFSVKAEILAREHISLKGMKRFAS